MPKRVLLVDRDEDTREMYAEFLKCSSVEVDQAADGRDALAKAISRNPDAIITDTRLPGIDGFELCALLRRDRATQGIPIVIVTGDGFAPEVARARAAGADAVLVKPCLPQNLLSEVCSQVRRARELQTAVAPLGAADQAASQGRPRRVQIKALSRSFRRHETTKPPNTPPDLVCPACDQRLTYQRSHIGGVSERHAEQWDDYECPAGCGIFQYRQRTRTFRRVS